MTVTYAVTFEFDLASPITHRGTVAASSMPTCFARAAREAVKAHPGLRWSSMVTVLLERLDAEEDKGLDTTDITPDPNDALPIDRSSANTRAERDS